jgi:hypothetical protein
MHCTLHYAPTLFKLADALLNYIFTSVWTKIYDYSVACVFGMQLSILWFATAKSIPSKSELTENLWKLLGSTG